MHYLVITVLCATRLASQKVPTDTFLVERAKRRAGT
jgi:hypothetical protein